LSIQKPREIHGEVVLDYMWKPPDDTKPDQPRLLMGGGDVEKPSRPDFILAPKTHAFKYRLFTPKEAKRYRFWRNVFKLGEGEEAIGYAENPLSSEGNTWKGILQTCQAYEREEEITPDAMVGLQHAYLHMCLESGLNPVEEKANVFTKAN
jgi:hypothetical protein